MKFYKKILYRFLYILFSITILHGCMVGPKFQQPEIESPGKYIYSTNTDSIINLKWWELFNDSILKSLIDSALINNKDVRIAASRIEEAAFVVGYNRADLLPSIGYSGSATRGNNGQSGAPLYETGNLFTGVGNVYWELDFWGKYRRATEAAKAELLASEYGMRSVQIGLISNVAFLYFQLLDYKTRLNISRETLGSRKASLDIISERYNEGIIPEIDLNQAQIQEAIAAANIPFYERLVANMEHALGVLLGKNPGVIESNDLIDMVIPPDIPVGIPSDLLQRRPDILVAEQLLKAQNARIGVVQAMRFPSIGLTGIFGLASTDLSNLLTGDALVWSLAGDITGPIFNFGKNKRRVEIERERTKQMLLEYEKTVLNAFADVEDALVGVSSVNRELEALQRQLIAAENAASLSRARYDGGVTSYLEVLETERSLFDSQLRTTDAFQRLLNSYVFLYQALGGGWITKEEMNTPESE